jgi:hypothetical protein
MDALQTIMVVLNAHSSTLGDKDTHKATISQEVARIRRIMKDQGLGPKYELRILLTAIHRCGRREARG